MELAECVRSWNVIPAAEAGYRLDGRRMDEVVPAHSISGAIKQTPASAEVRMGDTHVLATARVCLKIILSVSFWLPGAVGAVLVTCRYHLGVVGRMKAVPFK